MPSTSTRGQGTCIQRLSLCGHLLQRALCRSSTTFQRTSFVSESVRLACELTVKEWFWIHIPPRWMPRRKWAGQTYMKTYYKVLLVFCHAIFTCSLGWQGFLGARRRIGGGTDGAAGARGAAAGPSLRGLRALQAPNAKKPSQRSNGRVLQMTT